VSKDRRLGRGLAALLGTPLEAEVVAQGSPATAGHGTHGTIGTDVAASTPTGVAAFPGPRTPATPGMPEPSAGGLLQLPLADIEENPFQPRREFSEPEILSLAASLKEHDLLQPILVRLVNGRYQLISGERRLRAAKHAGWTTIPARVREADDRLVAELAIVENLQRKDLNPVEKALSFKRYLDEHRCTQDDLAKRLKIDRSTIANLMRLLELPGSILKSLSTGTLTAGHARALLPLGDEHEQVALAERIERDGLSVRDVERLVAEQIGKDDADESPATIAGPGQQPRTRSDQLASLEQEFRHALGAKVEIRASPRGRGKITIHFANHDEFDRLREQLTDVANHSTRRAA
jgi:ParB family transcriptional regulator, chromosome partitioning protein